MGRALSRYVPLDVAVLGVAEFFLSFTVIHLMAFAASQAASPPNVGLPMDGVNTVYQGNDLVVLLACLVGGVTLMAASGRPEMCLDQRRLLIAAAIAGILAFPLCFFIDSGMVRGSPPVRALWFAKMLGVWLATITVFRLAFSFFMRQALITRRIMIVGDAAQVGAVSARLSSRRGRRFKPLTGHPSQLSWDILRQQQIWGVIVAADVNHEMSQRLLDFKLRGMKVISDAAFQEYHLGRIDPEELTVKGLLLAEGFTAGYLSNAAKRACDIIFGTTMLLLTLPMMAMTALAIKLGSPGPVFYRQQRIGRLGRTFTLLKFRSMALDAEAGGMPCWAQKQDVRITRVGAFIRAARIDELPQLVNVLRGEMSLVGPRPERPHFVVQLARAIPFYQERSYVKPGLTGWAQVNFPYGASVEDAREKLAYDLYYAKHRSFRLDMFILALTIRVVLFREGAR